LRNNSKKDRRQVEESDEAILFLVILFCSLLVSFLCRFSQFAQQGNNLFCASRKGWKAIFTYAVTESWSFENLKDGAWPYYFKKTTNKSRLLHQKQ
jgi:hypothetical protein